MKAFNYLINSIKYFIIYKVKKDILFIEYIGTLNQLILIYYIIFLLLIFYLDLVTYAKILSFLLLWITLLVYKIIVDIITYYAINNNKLKNFIDANDTKFKKILNLLLFIQKWKNPLLILLLFIDKLFFKILRNLIYRLKNNKLFSYKKSNLKIIFYLQYFLLNMLLGPLKLILGFYYTMLFRLVEMPFFLFLLIRSFGFVLNILVISHILKYLYNIFGININIFIYFYLFLIFISMFIKYIDKDFKFLKMKYINNFISTDYIIFLRNSGTICGIILLNINLYRNEKISIQYIDIISSIFKIDIEESFSKYWENYKKNYLLCTIDIWKEMKNRPSWYIYKNLICWISAPSTFELSSPTFITDLLYIKYKGEKLNLKFPENIQINLDYLYEVDKLRLKLLLFMLWDIDYYVGNNNWNYLTYILHIDLFNIGCDYTIYDYFNLDNFKVDKNKKDLVFYDPESNMEFFNKLYKVIGMPILMEYPFIKIFSELLDNYIDLKKGLIECLTNFYVDDPLNYTWIRIIEEHISETNEISLIEYKIRDWIIIFLEEQRKEWELLKEKESIESRNWRLINEIENLLKNENKNV